MLAPTHALTGAAAWLALAPGVATTPAELAAGAVFAAGAALLPDLDHPRATAAQAWGPITRGIGAVLCVVAKGHRNGTHTLLTAIAAGVVTRAALEAWPTALAVAALATSLALVACEDLLPRNRWVRYWPANMAAAFLLAGWATAAGLDLSWLPAAVTIGWVAHLAGDAVTDRGVPLFAPFDRTRYRLTRLNTGGRWETVVGWALGVSVCLLCWATLVAWPAPWTTALSG